MQRVIAPDDNEEEIYEVTIEFNVETHPFFKRVGSDVHLDVPITYTQAVLGDTIQVLPSSSSCYCFFHFFPYLFF